MAIFNSYVKLPEGSSYAAMLDHAGAKLLNFRISSLKNISVAQLVHSESPDNPRISLLHGGFWGLKRVIPVNGAMEKRRHISI